MSEKLIKFIVCT